MKGPFPVREGEGARESGFALSVALNNWLTTSGPVEIFRTCGSCRNMQKQGAAYCSWFQATPPVEVILKGCEKHDDEHEVPF